MHKFTDETSFATEAAKAIEDFVMERLSTQRTVKLALSGGKSPVPVYRKLAESRRIPWSRVILFLVDERYAPLNSEDSNFRMISETLADQVPNLRRFYSYNTKEPIDTLVHWYDQMLQQQDRPLFDLVVLGLGTDGHTASLFPQDSALHEKRRLVAHTHPLDANGYDRMTLTFPALLDSRKAVFLIRGKDKAAVVERWLGQQATVDELPAIGMLGHPEVEIFLSEAQ